MITSTVLQQAEYPDKIFSYDLTFLRDSLLEKKLVAEIDVDAAILELRRFFAVSFILNEPTPMLSSVVDQAWHQFILFSKRYFDFCRDIFSGGYLHHTPLVRSEENQSDLQRRAEGFLSQYRLLFGDTGTLWDKASVGSKCCTDCHSSDCASCN